MGLLIAALVAMVPGFIFYTFGYWLGESGPGWAQLLYALGVPVAIGAIGWWLTSVADPGGPGTFVSAQLLVALLFIALTAIALLANIIGVLFGIARANRDRATGHPRNHQISSASSVM